MFQIKDVSIFKEGNILYYAPVYFLHTTLSSRKRLQNAKANSMNRTKLMLTLYDSQTRATLLYFLSPIASSTFVNGIDQGSFGNCD
jgi:hypothetical protein